MHSIALQKTLIVKKSESYHLFTIPDTMTRDKEKNDVISEKLVHCISILWVNTQNLTG